MTPADVIPFRRGAAFGSRRRIAFVINSLGPGGAERVMTHILQATPHGEWQPHLVLLDQEPERRTPPEFVRVHRLNCGGRLKPSVIQLRTALQAIEPDLVVSFLVRANVASIIVGRSLGIPVAASERSQLTTHLAGKYRGIRHLAASLAPRLTYRQADRFIACSEGVRSDLIQNFGVAAERCEQIPNPFDLDQIMRDAAERPERELPPRFMVSVGRLVESKGFADLIEAYELIRPELPLVILGEGPSRPALEMQVAASGLGSRIRFLGYARNPFAVVARAELFVSASHCEGFPNAMVEAMALGLPVVATDCPSGPAEILDGVETVKATGIHAGKYGVLTPMKRPDVLARALALMADARSRERFSHLSRLRAQEFRLDRVTERYWQSFSAVLNGSGDVRTRERMPLDAAGGRA